MLNFKFLLLFSEVDIWIGEMPDRELIRPLLQLDLCLWKTAGVGPT